MTTFLTPLSRKSAPLSVMVVESVDFELSGNSSPSKNSHAEWNSLGETAAGRVHRYVGPVAVPPAERNDTLELQVVLVGAATCKLADRTYRMGPRSIVWLFSGQTHELVDVSQDFQTWIARFDPELVATVSKSASRETLAESNPTGTFCRRLGAVAMRRLCTQLEDLYSLDRDPEQLNLGLTYLLVSAWSEYQDADQRTDPLDLHPAVQKAARLLRTHSDVESLEELAKRCGTSPSWLSRLFRKQMNVSLVDYRNQYRIERFFDLYLDSEQRNITQAAFEAGFGSYAQFHRVFRRKFGYSPAQLRRRVGAD